tara:strand:+ start:19011 stop:19520 length:510 start_codon:yes stop_codon:yes gene_type:complete
MSYRNILHEGGCYRNILPKRNGAEDCRCGWNIIADRECRGHIVDRRDIPHKGGRDRDVFSKRNSAENCRRGWNIIADRECCWHIINHRDIPHKGGRDRDVLSKRNGAEFGEGSATHRLFVALHDEAVETGILPGNILDKRGIDGAGLEYRSMEGQERSEVSRDAQLTRW